MSFPKSNGDVATRDQPPEPQSLLQQQQRGLSWQFNNNNNSILSGAQGMSKVRDACQTSVKAYISISLNVNCYKHTDLSMSECYPYIPTLNALVVHCRNSRSRLDNVEIKSDISDSILLLLTFF